MKLKKNHYPSNTNTNAKLPLNQPPIKNNNNNNQAKPPCLQNRDEGCELPYQQINPVFNGILINSKPTAESLLCASHNLKHAIPRYAEVFLEQQLSHKWEVSAVRWEQQHLF